MFGLRIYNPNIAVVGGINELFSILYPYLGFEKNKSIKLNEKWRFLVQTKYHTANYNADKKNYVTFFYLSPLSLKAAILFPKTNKKWVKPLSPHIKNLAAFTIFKFKEEVWLVFPWGYQAVAF